MLAEVVLGKTLLGLFLGVLYGGDARANGQLSINWSDRKGPETSAGTGGGGLPRYDEPGRNVNGDSAAVGVMSPGKDWSTDELAARKETGGGAWVTGTSRSRGVRAV